MSRDIPIIFSTPMVQALLDGRKTMTRRLAWRLRDVGDNHTRIPTPWQKVKAGDRIWTREQHHRYGHWDFRPNDKPRWTFCPWQGKEARFDNDNGPTPRVPDVIQWYRRPAIFMPRDASRMTLIVTETKIERLNAISEIDAMAEGATPILVPPDGGGAPHVEGFSELWQSLHGRDSWDANPEVVAITFRVVKANIDSPEAKAA